MQEVRADRKDSHSQAGYGEWVLGALRGEGVRQVYVYHTCQKGEAGACGKGV